MDAAGFIVLAFAALPVVYLGLTEGWTNFWTLFTAVVVFGGAAVVVFAPWGAV